MEANDINTWASQALAAFLKRCAVHVAAQLELDAAELRRWAR